MIKVLGAKRVLILVVLVVVNALLAALAFGYYMPEKSKSEKAYKSFQRQVRGKQGDIERLSVEFDEIEDQEVAYKILEDDGFFKNQNRAQAEKVLQTIQKRTRVISAKATISPGQAERNEDASKADYALLSSVISLNIEALDDVDIYGYLFLLEEYFPGHLTFTRIDIKREMEVNGAALRAIASGTEPVLVSAEIEILWRTMIPESQLITADR